MASSVPLNTRVEPDLKNVLRRQARERGLTLSEHVRDLLRRASGVAPTEETAGFRRGRFEAHRQTRIALSRAFSGVSAELQGAGDDFGDD
ncbi:hypothetical protein LCGC14_1406450 [marine sediment metagenome]|uniref:Uncharacterized protein n=1 Tax=marine sediment metagenome TaxID=412755 RepID=A0A0F9MB01_9ZZZZ